MNTTIHFVRHSEFSNPDRIIPGRMPGYHLDLAGKEKAKKVGEFFKDRPIKAIYTSPLERTFETANIISGYLPPLKPIHSYDLIEVDSNNWQAYKLEELYTNNYYEAFINDPETQEVPENISKLASRMEKFTIDLCNKHKGEEVVCVSHMHPIIALKLSLEGKPLKSLRTVQLTTASITSFHFDENCKLAGVDYYETDN